MAYLTEDSVECAAGKSADDISFGSFRKTSHHLRDLVVGYADVSVKRASLARVPLFLQSGRLGVILTLLCRENSERKGNIDT